MEVNSRHTTSIFERITSRIENKFCQLADSLTSIKNSAKTLLLGSEDRKKENINWICAKFIYRISVPINHEYETINEKKLSLNVAISSRFRHNTLSGNASELFGLIGNELLKQQDNKLSFTDGHQHKQVNLMLATLYEVYKKADEFVQKNTHAGLNSYLKSQIECLIRDNFIIEQVQENDVRTVVNAQKKSVIDCLENIHEKYKDKLNLHKENMKEKIEHKIEKYEQLQRNLKEYSFL